MDILPLPSESLLPSLKNCLVEGRLIQHPLLIQPYVPRFAALYNRQYRDLRRQLWQAMAARNWSKVVWLHERPFRAEALLKIARRMNDDQFWRLLGEVWIDTENCFQMRDVWTQLWTAERAKREQVMTEGEHDALSLLPEIAPGKVAIYRGCRDLDAVYGMSWAVSRTQALWFANRFASLAHMPLLVNAVIEKCHIQAYFIDRRDDEAEIVALPSDYEIRSVERLPLRQSAAA